MGAGPVTVQGLGARERIAGGTGIPYTGLPLAR